jgi:hypothetical protein
MLVVPLITAEAYKFNKLPSRGQVKLKDYKPIGMLSSSLGRKTSIARYMVSISGWTAGLLLLLLLLSEVSLTERRFRLALRASYGNLY